MDTTTTEKIIAPTEETAVYILEGITYLPHYRNKSVFVGPGYPRESTARFSVIELLERGAEKQYMNLWPRSLLGIVDANNP